LCSTGSLKAGADALLNHRPFELGEHAQHLAHRLAGRRGSVDALLLQEKIDIESVKLGQEADKVFQRTAKPINRPSQDDIEFAGACVFPKLVKGRPLVAAGNLLSFRIFASLSLVRGSQDD
jgi:hypothetical protein